MTTEYIIEHKRKVPIFAKTDVLVAGGGVAGLSAAICAARNGCRSMLIERQGFLGGMATAGLVLTVPPMDNGLQKEISERLERIGGYAPLKSLGGGEDAIAYCFDPEMLKLISIEMIEEVGTRLLLHTLIVDSIVHDGAVKGVVVENKSGRSAIFAKIIIDATGDGDVAAHAGAQFAKGDKNGRMLPVTLMFNMTDVDVKKMLAELNSFDALRGVVEEAVKKEKLPFLLDIKPSKNAPGVYAQTLVHDGELNIWGGSLQGIDGTNVEDLTHAETITRKQANILTKFLKKNVPGFENSHIEYTSNQVGVRETRRIEGKCTPTIEELRKGKRFKDTIAKPYFKSEMRIPYGCLLPKKVDCLLVVGRCISATPEAMTRLRLIPACIATGQAAGTAAALSIKNKVVPKELSISLLQDSLTKQGVNL